jgi:hypothetical protein
VRDWKWIGSGLGGWAKNEVTGLLFGNISHPIGPQIQIALQIARRMKFHVRHADVTH